MALHNEEATEKELKNSQAYQDCLDLKEPSDRDDEIYMRYYRAWRSLARFPDDINIYRG